MSARMSIEISLIDDDDSEDYQFTANRLQNYRVSESSNESEESAEAPEVHSESSAFNKVKKDGRISPVSATVPRRMLSGKSISFHSDFHEFIAYEEDIMKHG